MFSSVLALLLTVSVGFTYAYSMAQTGTKENSFVKGKPGIEIHENNSSTPTTSNTVNNNIKLVKVQNTGNIPAYARVMLVPGYKSAANVNFNFGTMPSSISKDASSFSMGDIKLNFAPNWSNSWFYVFDSTDNIGYFYYKESLPPSGFTSTLLASVEAADPAKLGTMIDNIQVDVITDSIQMEGGAVGMWKDVKEDTASHTISPK
jgi:hypothetical protein